MSGKLIFASLLISSMLLATSSAELQSNILPVSGNTDPVMNVANPSTVPVAGAEPVSNNRPIGAPVVFEPQGNDLRQNLRRQISDINPGQPNRDIGVDPMDLDFNLSTGETAEDIITISNEDQGELSFVTSIEVIAEPERDENGRGLRGVNDRRGGPFRDPPESTFALFKDGGGWGDAMEQMWGAEGVDIQQYGSGQFGNAPIDDYNVIWIREYQSDQFNQAWNQNRERFEEWVDAGGVLYMSTATNNWGVAPICVGGIERANQNVQNGVIKVSNDPGEDNYSYFAELCGFRGGEVMNGNSWMHSSYSQGQLDNVDNSDWNQVIATAQNNNNAIGVAVYNYGRGWSVIAGTTDSYSYNNYRQDGQWGWALNKIIWYLDYLANQTQWVEVAPEEGVIAAGGETDLAVMIDAEGLAAGEYVADLHIESNDQDNPDVAVRIVLVVNGAADINVGWGEDFGYPDVVNWNAAYPDLFTGSSYDMTVTVMNEGVERLNIEGYEFNHDVFSTNARPMGLAAGDEAEIIVTLEADESGDHQGTMTFVTNDPDPARYSIALRGEAGNPPVIVVDPDMVEESLFVGGFTERVLNVSNNGEAPLRFTIETDLISQPDRDENGRALRQVDGAEGPVRDNPGQVLAQFNWRDGEGQNQHKSGIAYDPDHDLLFLTGYDRNILAIVNPADNYSVVRQWNNPGPGNPMGAAYLNGVFYYLTLWTNSLFRYDVEGNRMENLNMGNIQPTAVAASEKHDVLFIMDNSGGGLPPFPPGDRNIYVWDVEEGGAVGSINNYRQMIENVDCRNLLWVDKHADGQLWCGSNGGRLQELEIDTENWRAVRRIQSFNVQGAQNGQPWEGAGHDGHNLICGFHGNANYMIVDDGIAEMYWMTFSPEEGEIGGAGDMDVILTFDAFGLVEGNYEADLHFLTNDPENSDMAVNVLLVVAAAPDITVSWSEDFGHPDVLDWNMAHDELYSGGPYEMVVRVTNDGSEDLHIEDISSDHAYFTANPSELTLSWHESTDITFTFDSPADEPGNYNQIITFTSDDPDEEQFQIAVHAEASLPPVMIIDPESINERLFTGGLFEQVVNVSNDGQARLNFAIETEIISEPDRDADARQLRSVDGKAGPQRDNPGQELGTFSWNGGEGQNQYKAGIAYDFDNDLLFLTGYDRNIFAIVDPNDDYRVVRQWNNQGNGNPMDAAWLDGVFYNVQLWNNALFRWDANGDRMDPLNLPFQVRAVAASQDLGVLFCLNNQDINQIVVINPENGQQVGMINNWRQYIDNRDCYNILWVDKHPEGQLWASGWDAGPHQIEVNTDNWQAVRRVQQFQFPNRQNLQPWDGMGWDGHNLILGQYGHPQYQIVDDGIVEMYWLGVDPKEGSLEGNSDMDVFVTLDAANLVGGEYEANLHFLSNDPARPDFAFSVALTVEGAPDIVVEWPEEYGYPNVLDWNAASPDFFTGGPYDMTINVSNHGTARLAIVDVFPDHDYFSAVPTAFNLQPGEAREIVVTFEAPVDQPDEYVQTLTISSNDPDEENFDLPLHADANLPPAISIDPEEIRSRLFTGGASEHVLNVSNFGDAPLRFTIEHDIIAEPDRDAKDRSLRRTDGAAGPQRDEIDLEGHKIAVFQSNGNWGWLYDAFVSGRDNLLNRDNVVSYRNPNDWNNIDFEEFSVVVVDAFNQNYVNEYRNNLERFEEWVANGGGAYFETGNSQDQIRSPGGIWNDNGNNSSNGVLVVSPDPNEDDYSLFAEICHETQPNNWNRGEVIEGNSHYHSGYNLQQFENGVNNGTLEWYQVIAVHQQNQQIPGAVAYGFGKGTVLTIGHPVGHAWYNWVQDGQWGSIASEIFWYLIEAGGAGWLTYEPQEGELQGEADMDIFVNLLAEGLIEGDYEAVLHFLSNDPANRDLEVNIFLNVTGAPDIVAEWPEGQGFPEVLDWNMAYDDLFSGGPYNLTIEVTNDGTADLNIEGIDFNGNFFSVDQDQFWLQVGESRDLVVTFNAPANQPGNYNVAMTIFSDDPDEAEFDIALHAQAGRPPIVAVDPEQISADLFTDEIEEIVLGIANEGQADLRFTIDHEIISEPGRDKNSRTLRTVDGGAGPNRDDPGELLRRINVGMNTFGGMGYDAEEELVWGSSYGNNRIIAVDPNTDEVVKNFAGPGGPLSMAFVNGNIWTTQWAGNQIFVYNRDGQNIETFNLNFGAFGGMGTSMELGAVMINSINDRRIHVINIENHQEIASFDPRNAFQNADVYGIEWVDDHPDGQLWGCANGRLWQVFVDEDWNCQAVQNFAIEADVQHAEMCNDGENMWHVGRWGESQWRVYDDGVKEIHWLAYEPQEGTIGGGGDISIFVTLDATALIGGEYVAELHILSNDPARPDLVVDVNLNVTGAPVIVAEWSEEGGFPEVVDWNRLFPDLFTDNQYDVAVIITNEGTADLIVEDVASDNEYFTAIPSSFDLAPGDEREVIFRLHAEDHGDHQGSMIFVANLPDGDFEIPLHGETGSPPSIALDLDHFEETLFTGGFVETTVGVANEGGAPLRFSIEAELLAQPERDENSRELRTVDGTAGPVRDNPGQILAQFNWNRSQQWQYKAGIAYDFDNDKMLLTGYSQNFMAIVDPANGYRTVREWQPPSNPMGAAWLEGIYYSIGWTGGNQFFYRWDGNGNNVGNFDTPGIVPTSVAASSDLEVLIVGDGNNNRDIFVYNLERQRIATIERGNYQQYIGGQWQRSLCWVDKHTEGQLWINTPGRAWQVSVDTDNWRVTGTVQNLGNNGDQEWDGIGHDGHNLIIGRYNSPTYQVMDDGITELYWLGYSPEEGVVDGGSNMDVFVTLDATNLIGGDYEADLHFLSNDPNNNDVSFNVLLHVREAADLVVEWSENFGYPNVLDWNRAYNDLYSGGPYEMTVKLSNDGTADLVIDGIASDHEYFSAFPEEFRLEPGAERNVIVTFDAPADDPGDYNQTLTVFSDDPDEGQFDVALHANASLPPVIEIDPMDINEELFTGGMAEPVLSVTNAGQAELRFTIEHEIISEPDRDADARQLRGVDGKAGPQRDNPGQELATFSWNGGEGQNQYKAGIAYDFDNDLLFLTGYDRNIFAIVDPNDDYRVVRQWNNQGNGNPMDAAWLDGVFYDVQLWNNALFRWNANGDRMEPLNLPFQVRAVAASQDLGVLFCLNNQDINQIVVINPENGQQIGMINNYRQYIDNRDCYNILWVDKHPEGQLWASGWDAGPHQIEVNTDNWQAVRRVQQFQFPNRQNLQPWDGMGWDGHNLILGQYGHPQYQIVDDGIVETYWIGYEPKEGTLAGGSNTDIFVTLNATDLLEGEYVAKLHFLSNDPANSDLVVDVFLDITGAADITLEWPGDFGYPDVLDWNAAYEDFYSGGPYNMTIKVTNEGTADLNVEGIDFDLEFFSVDQDEFWLQPGDSRELTVTFNAPADEPGDYNQVMRIFTNDPDEGRADVALHANATLPPTLVVDPEEIRDDLTTGEIAEHLLTVSNAGSAQLRFEIEHEIISEPERDAGGRSLRGVDGSSGPSRDNAGDLIRRINVPWNTFGGMAWDGELMWGCDYGNARLIAVDPSNDQVVANIAYGVNSMSLAWDGEKLWASPWAGNQVFTYDRNGQRLGTYNFNFGALGGMGSDLDDGYVYINSINDRRIHVIRIDNQQEVASFDPRNAWQGADVYGIEWVADHKDGQLWGHSSGRLWEVYVDEDWNCVPVQNFAVESNGAPHIEMANDGENMWVGGNWGEQAWRVYDDGVAEIRWLAYQPKEGTLEGDEWMEVMVTLNATGLFGGDYEAELHFLSNDPASPNLVLDVFLQVTAAPMIVVEWPAQAGFPVMNWNRVYPTLFSGGPYTIPVTIKNEGTDFLVVEDIFCDNDYFSANPSNFEVAPDEETVVDFIVNADETGLHLGTMTIISNDPHHGEYDIAVRARTAAPPEIDIEPASIQDELFTGGSSEQFLTVTNRGAARLIWESELEIISEPERDQDARSLRGIDGSAGPRRDNPGDMLGTFNWNRSPAGNYKAGIAWNPESEMMMLTSYGQNFIGIVDPANGYQPVREWQPPNNPMGAACLEGTFYVVGWNGGNQFLFRWDINGNNLGNFNTPGIVPTSVAASADLEVLIVGDGNNNRDIFVYDLDGERVGTIDRGNYQQYTNGQWQRSICWVDKHPEGQLWMNTPGRSWQLSVDTNNWDVTAAVQNLSNGGGQDEWDGIGHDGHNLIIGRTNGQTYEIMDDGITEMFWFMWDPQEGQLSAGSSQEIVVGLNGAGLFEGLYEADLHFLSNDPSRPDHVVNIQLDVTGASDIEVEWSDDFGFPQVIDWNRAYEDFYSGGPYDMMIEVSNGGTAVLAVDGIDFDHQFFSVAPENFVLDPEETRELVVTFNAPANRPGNYNQMMTIFSDDPDEPEFEIALHANASLPPILVVDPDFIEDALHTDEISEHILSVSNDGAAQLRFIIEHEITAEPERDRSSRTLRTVDGGAGPNRDNPGDLIRRVNVGINTFGGMGYDEEEGLVWGSSYGNNRIIAVDPSNDQVVKNFAGPGGPLSMAFVNGNIWTTQWAGSQIFVYNRDGQNIETFNLNFGAFGGMGTSMELGCVMINSINDRRIHVINIENHQEVASFDARNAWQGADVYGIDWVDAHPDGQLWGCGNGRLWQVHVDENWNCQAVQNFAIEADVQHAEMCNDGENMWHVGRWGEQQWRLYDDGVKEMRWLSYEPNEGTLDQNEEQEILVTLDATGLIGGDYEADLHFLSNDPARPDFVLNVFLAVTGAPVAEVVWSEAAGFPNVIDFNGVFNQLYSGGPYRIPVTVKNEGTEVLNVDDISCDNEYFTAEPSNFVVEVGESVVTQFILNADEDGMHEGTMTIFSDDPQRDEINIPVTGRTSAPPIMVIDPGFIDEDLFTGAVDEHVINISNEGVAELQWETDLVIIREPGRDENARSLRSVDGQKGPNRDNAGDLIRRINVPWNTNSGMAFDGELMWGCDYGNARLIAVDPENDQIVANIAYGVNSMGLAWDGEKLWVSPWAGNQVFTFDQNGQRLGTYNFNFGALGGMGSDLEEGYIYINCINDRRIHVISVDNQQEVASFDPRGAWQNADVYGIEWVTDHPDGQLWGHSPGRLWQVFVDENWNCAPVQNFAVESNGAPHIEMANDGENMWVGGNWGEQAWRIYDDGVTEMRWIRFDPTEGTVGQNADSDVFITLNATGLIEGDYEADLHFLSNDPANPDQAFNVLVHVTPASDVMVEWSEDYGFPNNLDWNAAYDDLFSGGPYEMVIEVSNNGVENLNVSDITSDHEYFRANPTEFELAPEQSRQVTVIFDAAANDPGDYNQTLTISSDDPDEGDFEIALHADASLPPVMIIDPDQIEDRLVTDEVSEHIINVSNDGDAPLNFVIEKEIISEPERDADFRQLRGVDGTAGPLRDNAGDELGSFVWEGGEGQNQHKAGIAYDFDNDLLFVTGYDRNIFAILDPNDNYRVVRQWNNPGDGNPMDAAWLNGVFYDIQLWNERIFRWDLNGNRLNPINTAGRQVRAIAASQELEVLFYLYNQDVSRLVVADPNNGNEIAVVDNYRQYADNRDCFSILWVDKHPEGQLWLNGWDAGIYQIAIDTDNWRATGRSAQFQIPNRQNPQPWTGIGFDGHNLIIGDYGHAQYQIVDDGITEVYWLSFDPSEGTVEGDSDMDIDVTLDASSLNEGDYIADLHFLSNDPAHRDEAVRIVLHVTGIPMIVVEWDGDIGFPDMINWNAAYPQLYTGGPYRVPVTVINEGTATLEVNDITCDDQTFSADPANFEVAPGEEMVIDFILDADADGLHESRMTIASNDPDGDVDIAVRGRTSASPIMEIDPLEVGADLNTGDITERTINISNTGAARLRWSSELEIVQEPDRDVESRALRSVDGAVGPQRDNLGEVLAQFSWNRAQQGQYKAGMAWDPENELMMLTCYSTNFMAVVNPANNYEVVREWQPPNNPMGAAWMDGISYVIGWTGGNAFLFRWDVEGNNLGNFNTPGIIPTSVATSPDLEVIIVGDGNNDRDIHVYNTDEERIATIRRGNYQQYTGGQWQRSLCWVDKHPEGQLWINTPGRAWQVEVDTDNWEVTRTVQQFGNNGDQEWDGIGHDGDNLWIGRYNSPQYQIVDDGVEELYWVRWEPELGEVAAGSDVDVVVTLNATDLNGGIYEGNIHFLSNDPSHWDVAVNVLINVTGAPAVETDPIAMPMIDAPDELSFESTYVGGTRAISVTISNTGTEDLVIERITSSNADEFTTDADDGLSINPDDEAVVNLLFHPTDIDDREGTITFFSNAMNVGEGDEAGQFWFDLVGVGQTPPDISTEPANDGWIRVGLEVGDDPVERELVISNDAGQGGDDLDWEIVVEEVEQERDGANRNLRSVNGSAAGPRRDPPESRFAMFKDGGGWHDGMENIFQEEGVQIRQYNSGSFRNAPLDDYEVIWIREYQSDQFNNEWNNNRARFEEWVDGGGVLYQGTGTNNWAVVPIHVGGLRRLQEGFGNGTVVGTNDLDADNYNYLCELAGWRGGENLPGNSWSHSSYDRNAFANIDGSDWWQAIAIGAGRNDRPAVAVYNYGRGFCMVTGTTDSHQYGNWRQQGMWGWALNKVVWYLDFLANQGPSWLEVDPEDGSLGLGEETTVTLTFDSERLEPDTDYFANLMIESNDPDQPTILINVLLRTGSIGPVHFVGYDETDVNHSLLVTNVSFDGEQVPAGWEVGAFTPAGVLAGSSVWEGADMGLAVWGAGGDHDDYFRDGETVSLRIWDNSADVEWAGTARVEEGSMVWQPNGFTALAVEGFSVRTQEVRFRNGWNLISINITPTNENYWAGDPGPEIVPMMSQFARPNGGAHHLLLMKNERGLFYVPSRGFNGIPYWNLTEGYQVRLDSAMSGFWTGMPIDPQADIPIARGWNMIAYFPDYPLIANRASNNYVLSPILDNVLIAKDALGRFMIPARDHFSNMPPWEAGSGYQINVNQAVVLNYPLPFEGLASLNVEPEASAKGHWAEVPSTGANMSVLISKVFGVKLSNSDQVAAFNKAGQLVGVSNVIDGQVGIPVWGDDNSTEAIEGLLEKETFTLKLWKSDENIVVDLDMSAVLEGKGLTYETDAFTVIDAAVQMAVPTEYSLGQNYPNPFNAVTRIAFGLPEASLVKVRLFDLSGREVSTLVNAELKAGHHSVVLDGEEMVSGVYIVKMEAANFSAVRKVTLVK